MKKQASEKSSAACKFLLKGVILAYIQTVWTQIRLLLEEQSHLGPHCLQQRHLNGLTDDTVTVDKISSQRVRKVHGGKFVQNSRTFQGLLKYFPTVFKD